MNLKEKFELENGYNPYAYDKDERIIGYCENYVEWLEKKIKVDDIIKMVSDNFEPKKCMPDGINSKEEHEEYLKAIGYEKYVKDLQHHKDTSLGLYATDKEPDKIFEEIFVHLIEKIGMDGEKTFSPMDYAYYQEMFNKGINLIMWRLS